MSGADKIFSGSIPDVYDEYLVPLIFEEFASDLASRTAAGNPERILETAAGSGVVTRALAPLLSRTARYTVTDLNQPMLDRAASQQVPDDRIVWQQADAQDLPYGDESFDAVCCQFGVMFYPDKFTSYQQAHRILRSGGKFVFNVWDHIDHNEFAKSVTEALAEVFPNDPPQFMARTPHGYHDIDAIASTLRQAGFSSVDISQKTALSTARNPLDPAIAYCQGTPLRNEILARNPEGLEAATRYAGDRIAEVWGTGEVSAKIQGFVFKAVA